MLHDVAVIGGGFAGMAAALQLLRARRHVLVIDAGLRRNRFAAHAHGFLGQDGVNPAEIARSARRQLEAYPTLAWCDGMAATVSGSKDDFIITQEGGTSHAARRVLFATGVSDSLPAIEGLAARWGVSVFHCPYCHGYELDGGRIGVIATGPLSLHQAQLIPEWGPTTLFTNSALALDEPARADLAARGVAIEEGVINRIAGHADVELAGGRIERFSGLFVAPQNKPATLAAALLGCRSSETPFGEQIWTNEAKETSVPGAFACGDAAKVPHSISLAVADGAWAGAQLHRSLVWP